MHKKITKCILIAMSVFALSGCGKTNEALTDTMPAIATSSDVTAFVGNSESKYYLEKPDATEPIDITSYVSSTDQYRVTVKSSILTDLFGFHVYDRSEPETMAETDAENITTLESGEALKIPVFKEFESSDGKLLQCEVDGSSVIYDGTVFNVSQTITEDKDGNLNIPLNDLAFAIGYARADTARKENSLTITLIDSDEVTYVDEMTDDSTEEDIEETYQEFLGKATDVTEGTDETLESASEESMQAAEITEGLNAETESATNQ